MSKSEPLSNIITQAQRGADTPLSVGVKPARLIADTTHQQYIDLHKRLDSKVENYIKVSSNTSSHGQGCEAAMHRNAGLRGSLAGFRAELTNCGSKIKVFTCCRSNRHTLALRYKS